MKKDKKDKKEKPVTPETPETEQVIDDGAVDAEAEDRRLSALLEEIFPAPSAFEREP